ncbi:hypothetical protein [Glaciecola sp. 1036]|uniref:hypothetical protein n=1 Tax=Alteromonadaceae TaxID=72275 RepID=UPI003D065289
MKLGIVLLTCCLLFSCASNNNIPKPTTLGQLDGAELRLKVLVEAPGTLFARDSKLEVTFDSGSGKTTESFPIKLLGVEKVEEGISLFSSDIDYNSHLVAVDDESMDAFLAFLENNADAAFTVRLSPAFTNLPNRAKMYYATFVRMNRLGEYEPLVSHMQIDVPK